MPIEFSCTGCGHRLRTPDASAGKKARCPQCESIVDIPAGSAVVEQPSGVPAPPPARHSPDNPFADASSIERPRAGSDWENPYASPTTLAPEQKFGAAGAVGELRPSVVSFEQIFSQSWSVFISQLGLCVLFGLMILGLNMGLHLVTGILAAVAELADELPLVIGSQFVGQVISFLAQTWITLGTAIVMINLGRTGRASLGDFFTAGPYYIRGLGYSLLLAIIMGGIFLVCLLPAGLLAALGEFGIAIIAGIVGSLMATVAVIHITLRLFLGIYFIVDRDMGVLEAMGASNTFMEGNKLITLLALIVTSLLGGLFTLFTCFVGLLFVLPFAALLMAVVYLLATGQRAAGSR